MKCTDRIGVGGSPNGRHDRPPSVVPKRDRVATAQPVVALMKSTPTNSSVDAYCFVQCAPSAVLKMEWAPTAQPSRGPTIWIAPREGTKTGSVPEELGLALGDALGVAVAEGVGGSLADSETLRVGVGVGFVAEAAVQPVRTRTMALAAASRAIRKAIGVQRHEAPRRAPRISASAVEKAA
jgi:hypothetical protein